MPETLEAGPNPVSTDRWKALLGFVILAGAGVFMMSVSWLKWPDLVDDFGEQAYIAWQLSEGKILYKDIAYLYGPFSGYVHAFIFKWFGLGLLTLALFNIGVVVALSFLIYLFIKQTSDGLTGTACTLAFLNVFAFGQYKGGGNFNFVCAYVYELPHGVALSLVTLYLFSKFVKTGDRPWLMGVYFMAGLVFLTKPEVFLALALSLPVGTAFALHGRSLDKKTWALNIAGCMGSFLVPPFLFFLYLAFHLPAGQAFNYVISPWIYVNNASHLALPLYQWVLGIDDIPANLTRLFAYFLLGGSIVLALTLIQGTLNRRPRVPKTISIGLILLCAVLMDLLLNKIPLLELPRPLPLFLLVLVIYYLNEIVRKKNPDRKALLIQCTFTLFSLALLLKIILNTRIYHYGFALALPGTLVFIRWVLYEYPRHNKFIGGPAQFFRAAVSVLGLVILAHHVVLNYQVEGLKTYPVGTGRDVILDYSPQFETRGPIVAETVRYIQDTIKPGAPIATLPTGNIINYMTRHPNPLRNPTLNPVEADIVREQQYLENMRSVSPPYILLVDTDASFLGARYLGKDYGRNIYQWIQIHYSVEKQFGQAPFQGKGFGIQLLRKKSSAKQ